MSAPDQRSERAIAAWNDGYTAYEEGLEEKDNPFEPEDECFDQWQWGFEACERDLQEEIRMQAEDERLDDPRHGQAEGINRGR